ncbi:zinc finger protein 507-like isoform X1 [Anguilla rostrata]|uniref:zinc finger protein 507-like isoform X1 n=1 Tax=Anguilla rostrata TaxID=7938 RepID=UPI0030D378A1
MLSCIEVANSHRIGGTLSECREHLSDMPPCHCTTSCPLYEFYIRMEETSGGAVLVSPTRGQQEAIFAQQPTVSADGRQEVDSLFQVIEKLSAIAERRPPRSGSLSGGKRPHAPCGPMAVTVKKPKEEKDSGKGMESVAGGDTRASSEGAAGEPVKEKWYSREQCGAYRCLICSYVCSQQRTLKTHAWKHAGLVRCSYPVFEDGPEATPLSPPEEGAVSVPPGVGPRGPESEGRPAAEDVPEFFIAEEPAVELQVTVETDVGEEGCLPGPDGLLSSAQLILGGGANIAGRLSVVVQRLPERGATPTTEPGTGTKPLSEEDEEEEDTAEAPVAGEEVPASRRRTQSESLLLHSLAAEALVAMPMTAAAPAHPSTGDAGVPEAGRDPAAFAMPYTPQTPPSPTEDLAGEGVGKSPAQAGISQSLLTVIEKLRERTNESASDEDVLRELRGNAQSSPGDGAAPPEGELAEARPGSKRPRRCPLRCYGDATEGRAKQRPWALLHQQPCQCPACQHAPRDSKDPENHVTHRCKTRVHCSKQRRKRRLQNHESSQHGYEGALATMVPVIETMVTADDSLEKKAAKEAFQGQRVYRCAVCDYTSSSWIGVRNHQRIHSTEKPYSCCSCNFSTTDMNSLRSHMQRHPQEQPTVQLLEQYRCSLCGYACRHPPSLKSHMWKHAGDQNYNYQQATRAIDRAISLGCSALAGPQNAGPGFDPWRDARVAEDGSEKATPCPDPRSEASTVDRPGGTPDPPGAPGAPPAPGSEYCVLLFCCCVCGFESPSKERLMEHMNEHQGEIISIILSRDPPAGY